MLSAPPLNGLVLAGGASSRMGADKGRLRVHGEEQRYRMMRMLQPFCRAVFLSCTETQAREVAEGYSVITDRYENIGPCGGLLSAFEWDPQSAWLVVACDLYLLTEATVSELVSARNAALIATTFRSPLDGMPEPLITIWEPAAFPLLQSAVTRGHGSPQKLLKEHPVEIRDASFPEQLLNCNTPEDLQNASLLSARF